MISFVRIAQTKRSAGNLRQNPFKYFHRRLNNEFDRHDRCTFTVIFTDTDALYFPIPISFCVLKAIMTIISDGERWAPKTFMNRLVRIDDLYRVYILVLCVMVSVTNCIFKGIEQKYGVEAARLVRELLLADSFQDFLSVERDNIPEPRSIFVQNSAKIPIFYDTPSSKERLGYMIIDHRHGILHMI